MPRTQTRANIDKNEDIFMSLLDVSKKSSVLLAWEK
jgi:hypothetical protein